jgi:GT2 family glycosyltransferase
MGYDNSRVGAVVIGRNEGDRLRACLMSVIPQVARTIYVDSGSTDGSISVAAQLGADTVELCADLPFTAARARNEGWKRLSQVMSNAQYVQFVDGDCKLNEGWIALGVATLSSNDQAAIVVGKLLETMPNRNVYHRLAAMEWDAPLGIIQNCGGIAFVRVSALQQVNGYDETVIAAEDDELCIRLRLHNWTILRIASEMATHDIRMATFRQWWRRAMRAGHGFAQVFALHGGPPMFYFRRELYRTILWGGVLPILALALAIPTIGLSIVAAIALYGASLLRTYLGRRSKGSSLYDAMVYAIFATISKFPATLGVLAFLKRRYCRQPMRLIEHKSPGGKFQPGQ